MNFFFSWALLPLYLVQFEVLLIRSEFVCNDGKGRCSHFARIAPMFVKKLHGFCHLCEENFNQYLSQQLTTKARSSIYVLDLRNDIHIYGYFSLCDMVNLFIYWNILDFFFLMSTVQEECWSKRPSSLKLLEFLFFIFFLMKIRTVCSFSFFWFFFFG